MNLLQILGCSRVGLLNSKPENDIYIFDFYHISILIGQQPWLSLTQSHLPQSHLPPIPSSTLPFPPRPHLPKMSALPPFPSPPLLIALSGPTSSGKTTLAHALTRILPNTLLIHADDFYRPDSEIPLTEDGLQGKTPADQGLVKI